MNKTAMAAALVAGIALGLGACTPTPSPNSPPGSPGPDPLPGYPQIVALDGLGEWLVGEPAVIEHPPGGLLRITQPIRSAAAHRHIRVQYRFIYLDAQGRPMRAQEDWRYIVIPALTQVFMDGNALSSEAVGWRLEIRSAR